MCEYYYCIHLSPGLFFILLHEDFEQILMNDEGEMFLILEKENKKYKKDEHHFEIHKVDNQGNITFFKIPLFI